MENSVALAKALRFTESEVAQAYWQAMQWAHQVTIGRAP